MKAEGSGTSYTERKDEIQFSGRENRREGLDGVEMRRRGKGEKGDGSEDEGEKRAKGSLGRNDEGEGEARRVVHTTRGPSVVSRPDWMLARGWRSPFTGNVPSGPCGRGPGQGPACSLRPPLPLASPPTERGISRDVSLSCLFVAQRRIKAIQNLERVEQVEL